MLRVLLHCLAARYVELCVGLHADQQHWQPGVVEVVLHASQTANSVHTHPGGGLGPGADRSAPLPGADPRKDPDPPTRAAALTEIAAFALLGTSQKPPFHL